jgi:hypothetical protein
MEKGFLYLTLSPAFVVVCVTDVSHLDCDVLKHLKRSATAHLCMEPKIVNLRKIQ